MLTMLMSAFSLPALKSAICAALSKYLIDDLLMAPLSPDLAQALRVDDGISTRSRHLTTAPRTLLLAILWLMVPSLMRA